MTRGGRADGPLRRRFLKREKRRFGRGLGSPRVHGKQMRALDVAKLILGVTLTGGWQRELFICHPFLRLLFPAGGRGKNGEADSETYSRHSLTYLPPSPGKKRLPLPPLLLISTPFFIQASPLLHPPPPLAAFTSECENILAQNGKKGG